MPWFEVEMPVYRRRAAATNPAGRELVIVQLMWKALWAFCWARQCFPGLEYSDAFFFLNSEVEPAYNEIVKPLGEV